MASPKNGGKERGSIEIYFAKKLANNDKKIRDRAVHRMKVWLSTRGGESMTSLDLMKLWKGLFYCMWFSDKPLIQEDLAHSLANLIHAMKDSVAVGKLIEGFFMTMGREWHGIDRLRLDKFYMLVRKVLKEIFEYLQKKKWNEADIAGISNVFTNGPCSSSSEKFADGIKMFVAETFLDELVKVTEEERPNPQTVTKLIDPFLILWAHTENILVFRSIESSILKRLLPTSEDKIAELEADCPGVAARVFELASKPEVSTKARKVLFKYSNLYKEAAVLKEQESNVVEEQGEKSKSGKKKSKKRKLEKEGKVSEKVSEKEKGKKKKGKGQPEESDGKGDESKLDETDKSVNIAQEMSSVASTKERRKKKKEKSNEKDGKLDGHKQDAVDDEAAVSAKTAGEALSASSKKEKRKKKKEGEEQPEQNSVENDGKALDEGDNKVAISTNTAGETTSVTSKKEKRKKKKQEKELPGEGKGDRKADFNKLDDVVNASINENTSLIDNKGELSFSIVSTSQTPDLNADDVAQKLDFDSSFAVGTERKKEKKGKRNKKKNGENDAATMSEEQPNDTVVENQPKESADGTLVKSQSNVDDKNTQEKKKEDAREGEIDISSKTATKKTKKVSQSATVRRSKRMIEKNEISQEDTETPSTKKKKVIFELSRNAVTSISNLKVSSAAVFTPDQKPSKGVLKTSSKRRRASDFF